MPSGAKTLALLAVVSLAGLALAGQAAAQGTDATVANCKENERDTQPASGANPIELQANKARPTFDVGLADKSDGNDSIFFSPKAKATESIIRSRLSYSALPVPASTDSMV